jgi:hypothetical protein
MRWLYVARQVRIALVGSAAVGWLGYLAGWLLKWMLERG